jgi:hypothetical protein
MRARFQFVILMCCVLVGCSESIQNMREMLTGKYIYKSEDPTTQASDHNFDLLTLRADGTYNFVQGGATKSRTEAVGSWKIWDGGSQGPQLLLGRASYPIQIRGNEVRLLVDNDVGIWLAKAN